MFGAAAWFSALLAIFLVGLGAASPSLVFGALAGLAVGAVVRRRVGVASLANVSFAVAPFSAEAFVRVLELLRREVVVLVSCSELAVGTFSAFERVVRLRVLAGFTCSCISGDSDVSFI